MVFQLRSTDGDKHFSRNDQKLQENCKIGIFGAKKNSEGE